MSNTDNKLYRVVTEQELNGRRVMYVLEDGLYLVEAAILSEQQLRDMVEKKAKDLEDMANGALFKIGANFILSKLFPETKT